MVTVEVPVIDVLIPATNCCVLLVVETVDVGIVAERTSLEFIDIPAFTKQPLSNLIFLVAALILKFMQNHAYLQILH